MHAKISRNDPCPCGSGKKYKHCHLRAAEAQSAPPEEVRAVRHALDWLFARHRKAMNAAFEDLLDHLFGDADSQTLARLGEDFAASLERNLIEWLLAQGDIEIKGEWHAINEYLLSADGPPFDEVERQWIAQLGQQPLRLYTVTNVDVGVGLTLCDALDADAPPLVVRERAGSHFAQPGVLIGCRVMTVGDHHELSGCVYPFPRLGEASALVAVRAAEARTQHAEDRPLAVSLAILETWAHQHVTPPALPELVDATSGEALSFITDHYRVLDAAALSRALAACADVSGDA